MYIYCRYKYISNYMYTNWTQIIKYPYYKKLQKITSYAIYTIIL